MSAFVGATSYAVAGVLGVGAIYIATVKTRFREMTCVKDKNHKDIFLISGIGFVAMSITGLVAMAYLCESPSSCDLSSKKMDVILLTSVAAFGVSVLSSALMVLKCCPDSAEVLEVSV